MPSSPELALGDDGAPPQAFGAQPSAPAIVLEEPPTWWMQQTGKAGNVFFNSAVVAMIRGWMSPPKIDLPEPGTAGAPEWVNEQWATQYRNRLLARRVGRDTLAFAAGCYLMDAVEAGMDQLRGKHDHYSKIMGGVAAGGLLGLVWYPSDPRGRSLITVAGAAVGLVSYELEQAGRAYMLGQQRKLEKELLHKPDDQLKTEADPYYLRALLRAKAQQMQASKRTAAEAAAAAAGGGGAGGRFFGDDGGAGGAGAGAAGGSVASPSAPYTFPAYGSSSFPSFGTGGGGGQGSSGASGTAGGGYRDLYDKGDGGDGFRDSGDAYGGGRGGAGGRGGRSGGVAGRAGGGEVTNDRGVLVITEDEDS